MEKINTYYKDKNFDFYIHDPKKDLIISKNIKEKNSWEPIISDAILNSMEPNGIFVDIGANVGWHTKIVQEYGYDTISFEPEPDNFKLLTKNCTKEKSILYNFALSDKNSTGYMERDPTNYGNSYITDNGTKKVNIKRLDDIITGEVIEKINAVKIDVQGYEFKVIEGGYNFFNNLKPKTCVIIEVVPKILNKNEINILSDIIKKHKNHYAIPMWNDQTNLSFEEAYRFCIKEIRDLYFDLVFIIE